MQPSINSDYSHYVTKTVIKEETTVRTKSSRLNLTDSNFSNVYNQSNQQDLQYLLDRSARKLRYKSKRTINYVNKMNNIIDQLNNISSSVLADVTSHKFYISIRNIIRDILLDWNSSYKLTQAETYLLRNCVLLFNRLVNIVQDITTLTSWLIDSSLINALAGCMSDIDRLLSNENEKQNFKQLTRLLDMFSTYYQRLPLNLHNENGLHRICEATMDCLVSSNYDRAFRKLKANTQSMSTTQEFFLIKCPSFLTSYRGHQSNQIMEQILDTMVPRYASVLAKHIQSIIEWDSAMIHAVHYLFLTVVHAKGYYTPYANGQPLQWLIDHIVRIISESSLVKKVNKKGTTPETILIDSALRTLAAFVHEPDLLAYIKQLKIISIFRSLILLPYESIVFHTYVTLSYTLEEDDIRASEKDSGRLLSNIFDSLRKQIKSVSNTNKNEELIESNISLLVEAIQVLVQHDQIKSEILKQNALSLLINSCQHFHERAKRLLLESLVSITFDEEAARLLRDNTQFIKSIEDFQNSNEDGIKKAAEKIIWNLIKKPEKSAERENKIVKEKKDEKKEVKAKKEDYQHDVMISYCHADKELVYRIHKFLTDKGFKVWVDRDNIYGPAMQAMADAVENTDFVIICMSDSYKRSVYCQAEAEYAFHCKRRLLPVIVRQGYRADGWLGLIMGSRIYVDFFRQEFKDACELLLKEITLQRENQLGISSRTEHNTSKDRSHTIPEQAGPLTSMIAENIQHSNLPKDYINRDTRKSMYRSMSISKWTSKDVLDFLYEAHLHYMMPLCELMTGLGLVKLFGMCQAKPNRFYRQLNDELNVRFDKMYLPIGIFTQFLTEIDRLISSSPESSVLAIERDAMKSKSVSPSQSSTPPPVIVKHTTEKSSSTSVLGSLTQPSIQINSISMPQQTESPTVTTLQTTCNVQITEKTAYRTESLDPPSTNYTVQPSQNSSIVLAEKIGHYESGLNPVNGETNQQINSIPYRRRSYIYTTQSATDTIYP